MKNKVKEHAGFHYLLTQIQEFVNASILKTNMTKENAGLDFIF